MKRKLSEKQKRKRLCKIIVLCTFLFVFAIYLTAGLVPPSTVDYSNISIKYSAEDLKTSFDEITDLKQSDNSIKIEKSGAYRINGELTNKPIYVAAIDGGVIYLLLDNASISCSDAPAIYIAGASKVVFLTAEGSVNTISTTVSSGLESAIYSDTDVTFNGKGLLNISSEHGIAVNCNASVRFADGKYFIKAKENAIRAAYGVSVRDGVLSIDSGADAIKTTTGGKSNGKWYGVVDICGGKLDIDSDGDGINSVSVIHIGSADVDITCGGGSTEITETYFGGGMIPKAVGSTVNDVNAKGLKADMGIYLNGGVVCIDSADDAVHSDGDVTVDGAELYISSDNDGIQSEKRVTLKSGQICVKKSAEGICGRYVNIEGGTTDIVSSDDGINATNNSNPIAALGFEFEILGTGGKIFINGGELHITASGDGLDSNGSIHQTGGTVTVISKSSGVEAPIDYTGTYQMTGGTIAAFGNDGRMMQSVTEKDSTVCSLTIGAAIQDGSTVSIKDTNGNEQINILSESACSSLILASDKLIEGTEISVIVDETEIGSAMLAEGSVTIGTVSDSMHGNKGGRPEDMQNGEMPPDMQGEKMPDGYRPDDMRGGKMGAFGFISPVILISLFVGVALILIIIRKKRKKSDDLGEEEYEDDDDLP